MRTALCLPFAPDAFALCDDATLALFSRVEQRVTEWVWTADKKLVQKCGLVPSASQKKRTRIAAFAGWKMAPNAGMVVAINPQGCVYTITSRGTKRLGKVMASRILRVYNDGSRVLVQSRSDVLLVDTRNAAVIHTWHLCTCADVTPGKSIVVSNGKITLVTDEGKTKACTAINAGHGVPIMVRLDKSGFHVVYMKRVNKAIETIVHTWEAGETLQCIKTTRFQEPFFDFEITGEGKWCCKWPQKGGYVIQNADGFGNSLQHRSAGVVSISQRMDRAIRAQYLTD